MPLSTFINNIRHCIIHRGQNIIAAKIRQQNSTSSEGRGEVSGRQLYQVSLEELCERTRFSKKEICSLYRGLKQDCPAGFVDEYTFTDIMANFFPLGDSTRYIQHVFRSFMPNEYGHLGFRHLLETLSTMLHGASDDKLRWLFDLYDVNQDGVVTEEEVLEVTDAIFDMIQPDVADDSSVPEQHARTAFRKLDLLGTGIVTQDTFIKACKQNPDVMNSLDAFHTLIMIR